MLLLHVFNESLHLTEWTRTSKALCCPNNFAGANTSYGGLLFSMISPLKHGLLRKMQFTVEYPYIPSVIHRDDLPLSQPPEGYNCKSVKGGYTIHINLQVYHKPSWTFINPDVVLQSYQVSAQSYSGWTKWSHSKDLPKDRARVFRIKA